MKVIKCDFGEFLIYDNYVMGIINEGVVFEKKQNEVLMAIFKEHFNDRPFGYISNRVYHHTIDPTMYISMSKLDNFLAIAIVSDDTTSVDRSYKIERYFFKGHFRHYDNLNDAHKWISTLLRVREMENKM